MTFPGLLAAVVPAVVPAVGSALVAVAELGGGGERLVGGWGRFDATCGGSSDMDFGCEDISWFLGFGGSALAAVGDGTLEDEGEGRGGLAEELGSAKCRGFKRAAYAAAAFACGIFIFFIWDELLVFDIVEDVADE
jgi:hypothetical protein